MFLVVELCGLSFRRDDWSPSNIVATALFGTVPAGALLSTDGEGPAVSPRASITWPGSLRREGWDIADDGLCAIFSGEIPQLVATQLHDVASDFLARHGWHSRHRRFVCHPGGAKVVTRSSMPSGSSKTPPGRGVGSVARLRNMSATTVLFRGSIACSPGRATGDRWERALMNRARPGFTAGLSGARQPVTALQWTLALVLLQRGVELAWAHSKHRTVASAGGFETDAEGYPFFVLLHAAWLASLAVFVPAAAPPVWPCSVSSCCFSWAGSG